MYSTLDVRLSGEERAFLRTVRHAGGSLHVGDDRQRELAKTCAAAGVLAFVGGSIGPGKRVSGVALTGKGHAYLDRLMRAH
ncbi:hypothetical protein GGE07_002494 [Sinorhizobium terangae]|uniref:Transcriptional regulator n=1 Tax=Sinorhizobium terangae TaxID=110322 RepID=A0A6N7LTS2_SINTE|nr:hypothetical protein [Sinorhizobium terangae]MBB4185844.1 hypothetical protein [Sinorhizobium terangae]MQX19364.1 hypothetical protein [Sinorhizobium terangae]